MIVETPDARALELEAPRVPGGNRTFRIEFREDAMCGVDVAGRPALCIIFILKADVRVLEDGNFFRFKRARRHRDCFRHLNGL